MNLLKEIKHMSLCTENTALKKRIFKAVLLVIIAAAFVPFVIAARYAVFQADDFAFYLGTIEMPGESYLIKSFRHAFQVYREWQGTYTTNLLNSLFNPLLRLGLIACLALAFTSAYLLSREINACFALGDSTLPIFAIVFLPILLYRDYNEVYL